jgi:hypothetical protein
LAVAGFISSEKDWIEFDKKWIERLKQDGVSCFHMVEFARLKGEFEGWDEERRKSLLADLMEIIQSTTYQQFGIEPFKDKVPEDIRKEFYFNAYSLAARSCAANVSRWMREQNWQSSVEYVFEDGDLGKGNLLENFKRDGYPAPIFKPKKDIPTAQGGIIPGYSPLQAADFLAYEFFLSIKHKESGRLEDKPLRWAMGEFLNRDSAENLRIFQAADLAELSRLIQASKERNGKVEFTP